MSQTWDIDLIVPATTSPSADIQRIIDGFSALRSLFSGASEPPAADRAPYMWWADTTTGLLKIRNAADSAWITVGTLATMDFPSKTLANTFTAANDFTGQVGMGGARTLGTAHVRGDVASTTDEALGQLFVTGNTSTGKRLILGVDTTNNRAYIRAVYSAVGEMPLILQPNAGPPVKIAGVAARATTEGTNHLDIFDGTAPVGTLANGISLYATAGELRVMDAAGNATLLSPHNAQGEWIYSSTSPSGKVLEINMERMMKAINAHFGWDFVKEFIEP